MPGDAEVDQTTLLLLPLHQPAQDPPTCSPAPPCRAGPPDLPRNGWRRSPDPLQYQPVIQHHPQVHHHPQVTGGADVVGLQDLIPHGDKVIHCHPAPGGYEHGGQSSELLREVPSLFEEHQNHFWTKQRLL